MNINNHNYEEFFILYWDDELSAEQKKKVESFVEENNELQEEFRLFGETRFLPDKNSGFKGKELLLINENPLIDFSNYNDLLLSYIDDELTTDQKIAVEKFAVIHPAVHQEMNILKKTKLQAEPAVVFPDKSILYRREVKARVISISWRKVAVAAALVLIAGFVTTRIINNNTNGETPELVSAEPPATRQRVPLINNPQTGIETNKTEPAIVSGPVKREIQKIPTQNLMAKNVVAANPDNKNNLPKIKLTEEPSLIAQQSTPKQPAETAFPENINIDNDAITLTTPKNNNPLFENSTVTERPAPSYAIYDASDIPGEPVGNGGIKGLLRKATRVFEQRTKIQTTTEDNKLMIGVFAVSLK